MDSSSVKDTEPFYVRNKYHDGVIAMQTARPSVTIVLIWFTLDIRVSATEVHALAHGAHLRTTWPAINM